MDEENTFDNWDELYGFDLENKPSSCFYNPEGDET